MTKPNHARTPEGAAESRKGGGTQRPAWVLPYQRARRALRAMERLIDTSMDTLAEAELHVVRRPIQASRELYGASGRLVMASRRSVRVIRELAASNACILREPERAAGVPELITAATNDCMLLAQCLGSVADQVFTLHADVLHELASGDVVPERTTGSRGSRIILAPRIVFARAFLSVRQPRVANRIASILSRRRRTPRPAAVRVPRRNPTGRAPPLFSTCLL